MLNGWLYLQALKQNYELPEMAFVETEDELEDSSILVSETDTSTDQNASAGAPSWLAEQISSGKEIYMKAAPEADCVSLATNQMGGPSWTIPSSCRFRLGFEEIRKSL